MITCQEEHLEPNNMNVYSTRSCSSIVKQLLQSKSYPYARINYNLERNDFVLKRVFCMKMSLFCLIYRVIKSINLILFIYRDFGIRTVALKLLHKLLPKLTHDQLYEIAQILSVDGPNECQMWTLEIYKWMYDYITNYLTKEIKTSINTIIGNILSSCSRTITSIIIK